MKLFHSIILLSLISTGCSVSRVNSNKEEEYCSPRARKHLEEPTNDKKIEEKVAKGQMDKKGQKLQEIFKKASAEGQTCFQDLLDKHLIFSSDQQVCLVISTSDKGALSFIDIEDNTNPITPEFQKCLINIFGSANYSEVPSVTATQMIRFHIRK